MNTVMRAIRAMVAAPRRALAWIVVPAYRGNPRPRVVPPKAEPAALIEARWRLTAAIDEIPRDQQKINELRRQVHILAAPDDGMSNLHRRGRVRAG